MLDSSLFTLLVGFLSGYLLLTRSWRFSFRYLRLSGNRSLFEAILWSLPFLAMARISCFWLSREWPPLYGHWHRLFPIPWLGTTVLAIALSCVAVLASNRQWRWLGDDREESFALAVGRFGSELEKLILDSVWQEELLQVTLENRKVYVGRALFPITEDRVLSHIELIPLLSGHRDPTDLRLVIDTDYFAAYEILLETEQDGEGRLWLEEEPGGMSLENLEDLRIIIPVSRMLSISSFNEELFQLTYADSTQEAEEAAPDVGEPSETSGAASRGSYSEHPDRVPSPRRPILAAFLNLLAAKLRAWTASADRS